MPAEALAVVELGETHLLEKGRLLLEGELGAVQESGGVAALGEGRVPGRAGVALGADKAVAVGPSRIGRIVLKKSGP